MLDVDGTLLPGSLGLHMLRDIADRDSDRDSDRASAARYVLDLHASYVGGRLEYHEMAAAAIRHFCRTLRGLTRAAVQDTAARVWADRSGQLFGFVRPMVRLLARHGIEPVIVSSSPEPVVQRVAAALDVARYRGSRFSATDGVYDGSGYDSPYFDGKHRTVLALCADLPIDWPASLAIGNSLGDLTVLSMAGRSFAFEPEPALRAEAERRDWRIVHRADVLASVSAALDGG